MPRFKTNFTTAKPRPRMSAAFYGVRDSFRQAGLDLFIEGSIRVVARNGGDIHAVFRDVDQARAWLAARASVCAGRAR